MQLSLQIRQPLPMEPSPQSRFVFVRRLADGQSAFPEDENLQRREASLECIVRVNPTCDEFWESLPEQSCAQWVELSLSECSPLSCQPLALAAVPCPGRTPATAAHTCCGIKLFLETCQVPVPRHDVVHKLAFVHWNALQTHKHCEADVLQCSDVGGRNKFQCDIRRRVNSRRTRWGLFLLRVTPGSFPPSLIPFQRFF